MESTNNNIIMIITIDLGNGEKDNIEIRENSDPQDLAKKFVLKNNLGENIIKILAENIKNNMIALQNEKLNPNNNSHSSPTDSQIKKKSKFMPIDSHNISFRYNLDNDYRSLYESNQIKNEEKERSSYKIKEPSLYMDNSNHDDYTFTPHINAVSNEILKKENRRIVNVHERLFNEAKRKKKNLINNSFDVKRDFDRKHQINKKKNTKDEINYGERLYQRCMKQKEIKLRSIEIQKMEKVKNNEKNYTFKPNIDEISNLIGRYKRVQKVEDYLTDLAKLMKQKREKACELKNSIELKDCSFHPRTNKISNIIDNEKKNFERSNSMDRFSRLYKVSQEYIKKQEERRNSLESKCSFKPKLNPKSLNLTQNQDFYVRMEKFNFIKSEKEKLNKTFTEELVDQFTGKEYFKPTICRPPKIKRNEDSLPVGDYLYKKREEIAQNKKRMLENSKEELIQWDKSKFNQFSFKLFEKRKQIKLKEIFDLFDSDEDGIISATNIDISRVGVQILELYTPLLCELEELNQTLNLEEFISASEKLLGTLSINEKALVLGLNKKGNDNLIENYSFQPEINMKSHVLAMKKRGNMKEENIYDYYMKEKQIWNENKINLKLKKEDEELKECVFRPQIRPLKTKNHN